MEHDQDCKEHELPPGSESDVTTAPRGHLKKPMFLEFRSGKGFIIAVVAVAVFTDVFLYGLIVPVFPFSLEDRVGVSPDSVQKWVSVLLAVYGVGLLVGSPVCGYIADRTTSRRAPFMAGLVTLAGSTVMLCIGSNITVLVIGRLLQGISAAVVWTVGLALLVDTVGQDEVGESMGVVAVAMSLGIFVAPLLGGVVYEKGGYYAVFAMAFGLIGVDIVLRLIVIEKKTAQKYMDPEEEAAGDPAVPADLERSDQGTVSPDSVEERERGDQPDSSPEELSKIRLFLRRMPPVITLLGHPRLLVALWATLMQAVLTTSFETTVPLHVHDTFGFGPTGAGLMFIALIVPSFFAPLIGKMCDRYGPRLFATGGFILLTPFLILLRLPDKNEVGQIVLFCALLALAGAALALVMAPVMAEITLVVRDLESKRPGRFGPNGAYGQAYSLFNVAFAGGSVVGPLLAGLLNDAVGWKTVTLVLGLLSLFAAFPTFIYTGGLMTKENLKRLKISRSTRAV